ncbi:ABC transporter permease [Prolixibacter sp. NT017]|uniref:ABC transporter permease n=1 Tax=Prolixibacter sp. NT017 TaxID=2652390 RepID=UPI0012849A0A|nr:ABC transporter permease [Prolixibacter sp. NT017]GET24632.1 ABC transporter permease [Prolixibacter sp. NT017]
MNGLNWKISLRNLWRNKTFTLINVLGLTLGFTAFIIVFLFIRYELSWDKTNDKYNRIYRVQRHYSRTAFAMDGNDISPHTYAVTASLLEKYPEFERVTILRENSGKFLSADRENQFYDETGICADSNFFDVFTYHFIEGSPKGALNAPFSIVLSQKLADKLFKGEKALGKSVTVEKKFDAKVTGVYTDLPFNSSLRPSYIISFSTLKRTVNIGRDDRWTGDCMCYALLKPGVDYRQTEPKIRNSLAAFKGLEYEELQLCPLSKIHLSFNNRNDYFIVLSLFGLIGFFILLMSAFNYMNLTIAQASTRGKEIAVKKINGGNRCSLVFQFLGETLVLTTTSIVLAFIITQQALPFYNSIVHTHLHFALIQDWKIMLLFILVSVVIGLLSGAYPALFMSSHKIVSLFSGEYFKVGKENFSIRKILVTFQFAITIFLICIGLFFTAQIHYMTNKNLGFDKNNLLYARLTSSVNDLNFEDLRNRLLQHPEIINASMSKTLPFVNLGGGMTNWEGAAPDEKISYRPNWVTYDFVRNMKIPIIEGRDFSREFPSDIDHSCLINETALKCFGWSDPIGKRIHNGQWTVVGVVKNYIFKDMHNGVEPVALILTSGKMSGDWVFAFRYTNGNRDKAKQILVNEFKRSFPNDPFEFHDIDNAFKNESTFKIYHVIRNSTLVFTFFNIAIATIGLLGLVSFTTLRRKKEIGIRKINGSSVSQIFYALNKEFFILLGISILIAWPGAYLIYNIFPGAFKIALQPWIPLFSVLIILVIVVVTTGYQTYKASTQNPVESLRYE